MELDAKSTFLTGLLESQKRVEDFEDPAKLCVIIKIVQI